MDPDSAADGLPLPDAKRTTLEFDPDKLFNAMPHYLHLALADGTGIDKSTSDVVLRLSEAEAAPLQEAPVTVIAPPTYTGIEGDMSKIPAGSAVLVSALVGEYLRNHGLPPELIGCTVYSPATGPAHAVRSSTGAIVGTRALVRWV